MIQPKIAAGAAENAVLTKAMLRAADLLDVTARLLASILGVSEATVSRMREQEFLLERGTKPFELARAVRPPFPFARRHCRRRRDGRPGMAEE